MTQFRIKTVSYLGQRLNRSSFCNLLSYFHNLQLALEMLRSLLLPNVKPEPLQPEQQNLFPDTIKQVSHRVCTGRLSSCLTYLFLSLLLTQNSRQTLASRETFEPLPFVFVDPETMEFRCDVGLLGDYEEDKLKFVTRVKVDDSRGGSQRNRILLTKEPIFANGDAMTFLLILEWFPNSSKPKQSRKGSFTSERQLTLKSRQKAKMDAEELLSSVFLLSQKIYIQEKFIDEFVAIISDRHEIQHRQTNCLTIFEKQTDKLMVGTMLSSTCAETKYYYYQNESNSNYYSHSQLDKSSVLSFKNEGRPLSIHRNSSRILEKSPRNSVMTKSVQMDEGKRQLGFNLTKVKHYFSAVQYLISDGQLKLQLIIYHLNDNRNVVNAGFKLDVIQRFFNEWPKYSIFPQLYALNRDQILTDATQQCISNYRMMALMELQELTLVPLENIYTIIKQFNHKVMAQFLQATQEYAVQSCYSQHANRLQAELANLQNELLSNYAMTKYEYGCRVIKNLEKKSGNHIEDYTFMKVIGKEEIGNLDIGYRMYKKLIQGKLPDIYRQISSGKHHLRHRYAHRITGNNEQDLLINIENRIEICQEKKKMLENAIELSIKEAESLQAFVKGLEKTPREMESVISDIE